MTENYDLAVHKKKKKNEQSYIITGKEMNLNTQDISIQATLSINFLKVSSREETQKSEPVN